MTIKIDYSYKVPKEEVVVGLYNHSSLPYYQNISQEMSRAADRYGVQLLTDSKNYLLYSHCLMKHAIVLSDLTDPIAASEKYAYLLDWYQTMSINIVYDNSESMLQWKNVIEILKQKYNYRINYLRPDIALESQQCATSIEKIVDNLVCDSVRVKYMPIKDISYQVQLDDLTKNYFSTVSEYYERYKLYHRSSSDGFIALRYSNGFYITATKTSKTPLDLSRISFVHHYNEDRNELFYSGNYLPSSDVVEATLVFRDNPEITALVHTHASDLYTRNSNFSHKIKVGRGSYGTPELGRNINKVIKDHLDDFIILEEHGEVFALTGPSLNISAKMKAIIEASI